MSATPDLHAHGVVLDCADHDDVVPFWEAALGWASVRLDDQFVRLRAPADHRAAFLLLAANSRSSPSSAAARSCSFLMKMKTTSRCP